MTIEFEIDKENNKIYQYVRISTINSTTWEKREINIPINDLTVCQCKACGCKKIVLKKDLICTDCEKDHNQYRYFKTIVLPKNYVIDYSFISEK